ncbi:MAG: tetratricopeptide repeat protein [Candidatus Thalassarchaeaceae archaeon]|nr:tetratricopeptide repeat protein [Candidatus Thalassarchaeaceae archaeon]|tara:strand:- start:546 stop:1700 length:1155 start_codon:yes stop_codon:yes gene_type:complete
MEDAAKLAKSGNDDAAITSYLSVLELDADNATAWYCLGVLYARTNSLDKAVEAFEKSDQIFPNHPPTVANLAYLLVDSDPLAASIYAKSALVTISENDELTSIADYNEPTDQKRVFIEARQIEEVETQNIEHSTYLDIDPIPNSYDEARTLTTVGDHSGAVAMWKGLLEQSPDSPEVWRGLGDALRSAGYEDRAIQCFKRAEGIESEPPREIPHVESNEEDMAEALILAVEDVQSVEAETHSRGDLDDAVSWYNMGINLLGEGKNDEALSSFEKAIGGCPSSEIELKVKAQNGRGNALYNSGRFSESVVAYHTAIGMDPQSVSGRTLFNMGSSYAAVEMFDDAIKCFTQAIERGLEKQESELCEKQISRCRLLSREQAKRQSRT